MDGSAQTEQAEGTSFSEPLRRYANAGATDVKLGHRGTLTNGELKAGAPIAKTPEVHPTPFSTFTH